MTKQILKISAYVLIFLALALGAYYFLLSSNDTGPGGAKKPFFGNLFPFGNNTVITEVPFTPSEPVETTLEVASFDQKVRLISNEPVAGSVFIATSTGDIIRYIEKATGHIFDAHTADNVINRVSNTTIPQLYTAKFTENGNGFIAQYIKDADSIETFYGKITGSGPEKTTEGTILSSSIYSFAVSPNKENLFTLEKRVSGSEGYVSKPDGSNKKLIWTSPLKGFIPSFIGNTAVGLTSKPYITSIGLLFRVNTATGGKDTLISNEYNLSTLPNKEGTSILYINNASLFVLNTQTNLVTELSPKTFPEKCVWASDKNFIYCAVPKQTLQPSSLYAWYKGEVSYSDDIWQYDITNNIAQKIVDLSELSGRTIDISSMTFNKNDSLLLIESKSDGSLWTVRI